MALNEDPDVVQLYWGYWLKAMACSTPSLGKECIFVAKNAETTHENLKPGVNGTTDAKIKSTTDSRAAATTTAT